MSKARAKPSSRQSPVFVTPLIDPVRVSYMADRVQAGDVVETASVEEFGVLLTELQRRGYALRERSEAEKHRAPFTFEVMRTEYIPKI
jgi:hypothetical protein